MAPAPPIHRFGGMGERVAGAQAEVAVDGEGGLAAE